MTWIKGGKQERPLFGYIKPTIPKGYLVKAFVASFVIAWAVAWVFHLIAS